MKKIVVRVLLIIGILLVIAGIGFAGYGIYQKLTMDIPNPVATIEVEGYGTITIELYPDKAPNTVANFIRLANRGYYDNSTFHRTMPDFVIQGGAADGDTSTSPMLSDLYDLDEVLNDKDLFEEILEEFYDGEFEVEETTIVEATSDEETTDEEADTEEDTEDEEETEEETTTITTTGETVTITSYKEMKEFINETESNISQFDDFLDVEYTIAGEFIANGYNDNNISHEEGVISMARSDYSSYGYTSEGYDSASCQFFITTADDSSSLDGSYAAFGKVIDGMDVVEEISNVEVYYRDEDLDDDDEVPTDDDGNEIDSDTPVDPPVITSITVETYGVDYGAPEVMSVFDITSILYQQYLSTYYSS